MSACACWSCGADNDAATGIGPTDPGLPEAGSVSVCGYCAAVSIFTDTNLGTRRPTADELLDVMSDKTIRKAVAAIHYRNAHIR